MEGNVDLEVTDATSGIDIRLLTMQVSLLDMKVRREPVSIVPELRKGAATIIFQFCVVERSLCWYFQSSDFPKGWKPSKYRRNLICIDHGMT